MKYYDPLDCFYKSTVGGVKEDEKITFRVKGDFPFCNLIYRLDGSDINNVISMEKKGDFFETEISFSIGLYFYCFSVDDGRFLGKGKEYLGVVTDVPKFFQLLVSSKDYRTPSWIKGGVIYQIFPDRFYRGEKNKTVGKDKILRNDFNGIPYYLPDKNGRVLNNDFFGGDFKGIIEKLDYLKDLGVSVIYLNPIFKAYSNHRYDIGDYMAIDPLLGTEEDFILLVKKAKENGISIILDGVFNHTGTDSVYFNKYGNYPSVGAYQSTDSKYYDWYKFIDYPDKYEAWWGVPDLPALNKNNALYIDFITGKDGVLEKYTKMGIGGWRLDVVDELPDEFVEKIRCAVKGINNNAIIIGEVWEDATNKISYGVRRKYFSGNELDSVMNYTLKDAILHYVNFGDSKFLSFTVKEQIDHYPENVLNSLMNILSTHDTFRLLSAVGGVDVSGKTKEEMSKIKIPENKLSDAIKRQKAAALLQFTLPGVPSVYYGDEIGMQGYTDPLNRGYFSWDNVNNDILSFYRKLGALRSDYDVFAEGKTEIIYDNDGVFVFKRKNENSEVFIALNFGKEAKDLSFTGELFDCISENKYTNIYKLNKNDFVVLIKDR